MPTARRTRWMETAVTLLLGAHVAAGLWLAGAPDIAFVGFVLAAVSTGTRGRRRCLVRRRA